MGKLVEIPLSPPTCTPNCFLLGFCKFILRVAQNPILSQISPNVCEGILHLSNFFLNCHLFMTMIIRGSVAVVRDRSIKSQSGATSSFNSIFVFKILCSDDDTDKVAMVVLCPSLPLLVNSPTPPHPNHFYIKGTL